MNVVASLPVDPPRQPASPDSDNRGRAEAKPMALAFLRDEQEHGFTEIVMGIEDAMLKEARLMLKLFDTIKIGGVLATVVEVHNEHAFEIEFHDEREDRVVTLDLQPTLAASDLLRYS